MPVGRPRLPPSDDPVVQAKREKARAYAQEGRDKAKVRTAKAKAGATIAGAIKRKLATPKKKKVDDNRLHNLPEDLQRKIMKMAYVPPTKKELRIEYANNFNLYAPISFTWGGSIKDYLRDNYPQIIRRFYRKLGEDDYVEGEWIMYGKDRRGVILVLNTYDDTEPQISLRIKWGDMPYGMEQVFDNEIDGWKEAYDKNYGNSKSSSYGSSGGGSGFPNISTPSVMSMGSLAGSYSGNLSGSSTPKLPKRKKYYNEYQEPLWSSSASSSDYSILTPITAHRRAVEKGYASKSSSSKSSSSKSSSSGKVAGSRRIS